MNRVIKELFGEKVQNKQKEVLDTTVCTRQHGLVRTSVKGTQLTFRRLTSTKVDVPHR